MDGRGWRWGGCSTAPAGGAGWQPEGARAALDYAFTIVGADHVISVIDPENSRSIRVAEKIGERFEREYDVDGNRALIYGVTR